ncbi:MAG: acylneuraminate cytidylyltransferase, partial [Firmicutes bacterium]|nr:acylneuraminate cytidylyltransferase [Bacillota bacterium]
ELPTTYLLNGAVYVARSEWLLEYRNFHGPETVAFPMPLERSVDIDAEIDFLYAELLMREGYYDYN